MELLAKGILKETIELKSTYLYKCRILYKLENSVFMPKSMLKFVKSLTKTNN